MESEEERNRLFENLLHEDTDYMQRGNYFLVGQTLLLVAFTSIGTSPGRPDLWIALFGSLFTGIWIYVAHHHLKYIRYLQSRCANACPEYLITLQERPRGRIPLMPIFAYVIPGITLALWLVIGAITSQS